MKLDMYLQHISSLGRAAEADRHPEDVASFLNEEASRMYAAALELRFLAEAAHGLAKAAMLSNAETFEEYSRQATQEAFRVVGLVPPGAKPEERCDHGTPLSRLCAECVDPVTAPLPFVASEDER